MIHRAAVMLGATIGVLAVLAWGDTRLTVWEAMLVGVAAALVTTWVMEKG